VGSTAGVSLPAPTPTPPPSPLSPTPLSHCGCRSLSLIHRLADNMRCDAGCGALAVVLCVWCAGCGPLSVCLWPSASVLSLSIHSMCVHIRVTSLPLTPPTHTRTHCGSTGKLSEGFVLTRCIMGLCVRPRRPHLPTKPPLRVLFLCVCVRACVGARARIV